MNQKGVIPIAIILIGVLIAGAVGAMFFIKKYRPDQPKSSPNPVIFQQEVSSSPTLAVTSTPLAAKPTAKPSAKQTSSPTATAPTPVPTNTPSPAGKPAPAAKSACAINVSASPLDPSASFDNPLTVQLTHSEFPVDGKYMTGYMTGAQWDFDGNGSWDTDMSQLNGSIAHTFASGGNYDVKLQLKMSDGEITPTCSKTVTVPMGIITLRLSGQVYSDNNCNAVKEAGEQGVSGVTVNIIKLPEYSMYTTLTSDSNGNYNLSRVVDPQGSLYIQPSPVAAPGYKINADSQAVSLSSDNLSASQDLPLVPYGSIGLCSR